MRLKSSIKGLSVDLMNVLSNRMRHAKHDYRNKTHVPTRYIKSLKAQMFLSCVN
ncbi:hypothetical protein RND71_042261 [Anisodus tanguticus]|uniref:Uncharacterized protein n=1 Tax=Anisodus tanguticus TaxID=243964 RepID=A0AAE1QR72_9SOLA|nr:hypothetical protein RND71_042261 [Anisodus tanguticus]